MPSGGLITKIYLRVLCFSFPLESPACFRRKSGSLYLIVSCRDARLISAECQPECGASLYAKPPPAFPVLQSSQPPSSPIPPALSSPLPPVLPGPSFPNLPRPPKSLAPPSLPLPCAIKRREPLMQGPDLGPGREHFFFLSFLCVRSYESPKVQCMDPACLLLLPCEPPQVFLCSSVGHSTCTLVSIGTTQT